MSKKPESSFEVRLEGAGIAPEAVPLSYLSRLLSAVQRLAAGVDTSDEDEESEALPEGKIGLLDIRRGSVLYRFAAAEPLLALTNLRRAGEVLEQPEALSGMEYVLGPVDELSTINKSLCSRLVLKEPGENGAILARIGPDTFSRLTEQLLIRGESAITGKVERVGGATEKKCGLRVPGRLRMLICRVETPEVARKLGEKLYQEVVVHGIATWIKTNWTIVSFKIQEVYQPKLGSASEALARLRRAGGSAWDDVEDPEAYIKEVSGIR